MERERKRMPKSVKCSAGVIIFMMHFAHAKIPLHREREKGIVREYIDNDVVGWALAFVDDSLI